MTADNSGAQLGRAGRPSMLETGVPNLDRVLGGGIRRGSTVMLIGAPGTGKTMLAQQLAFSLAAQGENTLYLTGYSETHDKLLAHSGSLRFFAQGRIGQEIQLLNLTDLLQTGEAETEAAIVAATRQQRASLVVLDGFRGMRRFLPDDHAVAHFLYSLGAKLALLGATTLVASEGDPDESARFPELTVCDVIIALRRQRHGSRFRRMLDVVKSRGAAQLEGLHPYSIADDGITLYPRLETVVGAVQAGWSERRAPIGVPQIDALLGGGLTVGTVTLVAGTPGVGKTLLGLHFAAEGVRRAEPTLVITFMEDVAQLRAKGRAFGLGLEAAEAAGRLRILSIPGYDIEADQVALLLREDVERRGVQRLVLDSSAELQRGLVSLDRQADFLAALVSYLRERQVTAYVTLDIDTIVGPTLQLEDVPLSILAENLLLLRYAEYQGALHRLLAVLKMRFSGYDSTLEEYRIVAGEGFQILGPAPVASGLLTGVPQFLPVSGGAPPRTTPDRS